MLNVNSQVSTSVPSSVIVTGVPVVVMALFAAAVGTSLTDVTVIDTAPVDVAVPSDTV